MASRGTGPWGSRRRRVELIGHVAQSERPRGLYSSLVDPPPVRSERTDGYDKRVQAERRTSPHPSTTSAAVTVATSEARITMLTPHLD